MHVHPKRVCIALAALGALGILMWRGRGEPEYQHNNSSSAQQSGVDVIDNANVKLNVNVNLMMHHVNVSAPVVNAFATTPPASTTLANSTTAASEKPVMNVEVWGERFVI